MNDSPPSPSALEDDRATGNALLVTEVKCRDSHIFPDGVNPEIFRNKPLERWATRRDSTNGSEHDLKLRLNGGTPFEPLRRLRRRKEHRHVIVE